MASSDAIESVSSPAFVMSTSSVTSDDVLLASSVVLALMLITCGVSGGSSALSVGCKGLLLRVLSVVVDVIA